MSNEMTNPLEIKKLADQRLREAQVLFQNGMCDGAFYLAGYSVELALKAKICERLGIPNLFDEANTVTNSIKGIGEIRKTLKTHNLFTLLIFSGLKIQFDNDKATSKELAKANSLLFNAWDENARYKPCGHVLDKDVEKLITSLSGINGILTWIEQN
ncbi:MAG: HEPN domain-containing protein [Chitinophagaceae bacterium]|nr:HEPN domain-containing protein [Chitinophagaceae bacterium]